MKENERWEQIAELLKKDDMDFYEEYLLELSDEEIEQFFEENPDFMKEYNMHKDRIPLLRDVDFREILRKMKNSLLK